MLAIAPTPVIAQEGGASILFFVLIIAVFYLLLIRPQQKRAKQQRQLVNSLETNDRIVTIGGLHGTITSVDEDTVRLEVSPGTTVTMAKQAVSKRLIDIDEDEE